jgi:hypothetical protein
MEDASGACAGEAAPLRARQRPPAVRVTLKSVTATRAQWQRDLGWQLLDNLRDFS